MGTEIEFLRWTESQKPIGIITGEEKERESKKSRGDVGGYHKKMVRDFTSPVEKDNRALSAISRSLSLCDGSQSWYFLLSQNIALYLVCLFSLSALWLFFHLAWTNKERQVIHIPYVIRNTNILKVTSREQ